MLILKNSTFFIDSCVNRYFYKGCFFYISSLCTLFGGIIESVEFEEVLEVTKASFKKVDM